MRSPAVLALLGLLVVGPLGAQALLPTETPEQVAALAFEKVRAGDWEAFARLIHPEDLGQIRKVLREVLEIDTMGRFGADYLGIESLEAFDRLDGAQVLANLMRRMSHRIPALTEGAGSLAGETIGSVAEGADIVHLVQRHHVRMGALTMKRLEVTSLKKHEGQWRMLTKDGLPGRLEALKAVVRREVEMAAPAAATGAEGEEDAEAAEDGDTESAQAVPSPTAPRDLSRVWLPARAPHPREP
jgi:hypothetical protein